MGHSICYPSFPSASSCWSAHASTEPGVPHWFIKIKSLAPIWTMNDREYRRHRTPWTYQRIRLYNTTGFRIGQSLSVHWRIPGYIRFELKPYFNLDQPESLLGRTFRCSQLAKVDNKNSLLVLGTGKQDGKIDAYVFATHSDQIGYVDLASPTPIVQNGQIISASEYGRYQNILWLLRRSARIRSLTSLVVLDDDSESLLIKPIRNPVDPILRLTKE